MGLVELSGTLLAGTVTLFILSFMYKENPLSTLAEYLAVGFGVANGVVMAVTYLRTNVAAPLSAGTYMLIIPLILGGLLFFMFSKRYFHFYRISLALMIGVGTGLVIRGAVHTQFVNQIVATLQPLTSIDNIIFFVGVITTVTYFILTMRHKGPLGVSAKIGRLFIMVALGAAYGNTIMMRETILIQRLQFLLQTDSIYLIPIAFVVFVVVVIYSRWKKV